MAVEPRLEDAPTDTFVLRGGTLGTVAVEKNMRKVREAYGIWGICVAAEPECSPDEIAAKGNFGNRQYMTCLSQELAMLGLRVVKEPYKEWPNALIVFPEQPQAEDLGTLANIMKKRPLSDNPTYRGT